MVTDEEFQILQKYEKCTDFSCLSRDLDEKDRTLVEKCAGTKLMKLGHRREYLVFGRRIETARLTHEGYIAMMNEYRKKFNILVREPAENVVKAGG